MIERFAAQAHDAHNSAARTTAADSIVRNRQLEMVECEITTLLDQLEDGIVDPSLIKTRLNQRIAEKTELEAQIATLEAVDTSAQIS